MDLRHGKLVAIVLILRVSVNSRGMALGPARRQFADADEGEQEQEEHFDENVSQRPAEGGLHHRKLVTRKVVMHIGLKRHGLVDRFPAELMENSRKVEAERGAQETDADAPPMVLRKSMAPVATPRRPQATAFWTLSV